MPRLRRALALALVLGATTPVRAQSKAGGGRPGGLGSRAAASRVASRVASPTSLGSQAASPPGLGSRAAGSRAASPAAPPPSAADAPPKLGSRAAGPRAASSSAADAPPKLGSRAAGSRAAAATPTASGASEEGGYRAKVTTAHPTAMLLLIDWSGSMATPWGTSGMTKAQATADAVNRILMVLVRRCQQGHVVKDYIDVGVLGAANLATHPALPGRLAGRLLVKTSELADGAVVEGEDVSWVKPTFMLDNGDVQAFQKAGQVLGEWVTKHPDSHPPVVMNITDGYAVDGDPTPHAEHIRQNVGTRDGKALVYNIHIGEAGPPIVFPDSEAELPNEEAKRLFRMSSVLPPAAREAARRAGYPVTDKSRGFAYNADLPHLLGFLEVGSSVAELR